MIENVIVAAFLMVLELFILQRIITRHKETENAKLWEPFRKMMLDGIVHYSEELIKVANFYGNELDKELSNIKQQGALKKDNLFQLSKIIKISLRNIYRSKKKFFNVIQTVAPSLKPYAAQYCNEVLWFEDALKHFIELASKNLNKIDIERIDSNDHVSRHLIEAKLTVPGIRILMAGRFAHFKENFIQSVWKIESLHYYEPYNQFFSPTDYQQLLDGEEHHAKLEKKAQTTQPSKSFFEVDFNDTNIDAGGRAV